MTSNSNFVFTINGGSSSIKFALYSIEKFPEKVFYGDIENIGNKNAKFNVTNIITGENNSTHISAANYDDAVNILIDWFQKKDDFGTIKAIGYRIVHGMKHTVPEPISAELMIELKAISAYDPEHLPGEIKLIETFSSRYPDLLHVACFDTSFHTSMPRVAKLLSIPRRYNNLGIQRYGFHGLSYEYLLEELKNIAGNKAAQGKVILAHLGNGASLAAVKDLKSIDTSMGFTPTSGLTMGTRSGDIDPGVAWYLMEAGKLSPKEFSHLTNHESGLLGLSETSADMRELLKSESSDNRAAEAIELFCYQVKKWIGSFAAVLGGLETVVFAGGIGENAPEVRERICQGLQFLGIELDGIKNKNNEAVISTDASNVCVRVIKTNEELMIAGSVCKILRLRKDEK